MKNFNAYTKLECTVKALLIGPS